MPYLLPEDSNIGGLATKTFYRPLEAAIRWSGLWHIESEILELAKAGPLPMQSDTPGWSHLLLNHARVLDAVVNNDLPYGLRGITCRDTALLQHPDLSVRHVDLKAWMLRFYPDQRPSFLFDQLERQLHPSISLDTVQALIADREALKLQLANRAPSLGPRGEGTYLNIVGGLLALLLGKTPNGAAYSFATQDAVVEALTSLFRGRVGMSERTLWAKFAAAKRHLEDS